MSGEDGSEQCESWDIGLCETHITADVAYAADRYREITGDGTLDGALSQLYLETARYWLSRFTWEAGQGPVFQLLCKRSGRILRRSGSTTPYQLPGAA